MTDTLESNARCRDRDHCDTPVHALCVDGEQRFVECTPSADGEFALVAGRLKELPIGAMVAAGCMRFRDHKLHCRASLRPEPSTVPTRPDRPTRIRRQ